jgi:S1-C subfamily serine protease
VTSSIEKILRLTSRCRLRPLLIWSLVLSLESATLRADVRDVRRDAAVEAIERVLPSVVNIETRSRGERRFFYDWWRENWGPFFQEMPPQYSAGSGVIIHEDGYVLTNVHVVEQADEIWVKLSDGSRVPARRLVGVRKTDVALLKLLGKPGEKYIAARFGADDDLLLGETVLALGNPFGLGVSVSRGILSSKNRRSALEGKESLDIPDWLQTDASINPGNSGGPLINLRGEIIGINVAVHQQGQGIGFAIPTKRVTESLAEIFTPELIEKLWFGARLKAGSLPLRVVEVAPKSPAEKAGLMSADSILTVNDKPARSFIDFNSELISAGGDRPISITIQRGSEQKHLSLRLVPEKAFFNADLIRQKIGANLQQLTEALAESLGINMPGGLIVVSVDKNSPAAEAELQRNYIILAIDGQPTYDIATAAKILQGKKKGEKAVFNIVVERTRGNFFRRDTLQTAVTVR